MIKLLIGAVLTFVCLQTQAVSANQTQLVGTVVKYDKDFLVLKSGSVAIGAGTAMGAPTVDILGVARTAPYTAGAYSYPY